MCRCKHERPVWICDDLSMDYLWIMTDYDGLYIYIIIYTICWWYVMIQSSIEPMMKSKTLYDIWVGWCTGNNRGILVSYPTLEGFTHQIFHTGGAQTYELSKMHSCSQHAWGNTCNDVGPMNLIPNCHLVSSKLQNIYSLSLVIVFTAGLSRKNTFLIAHGFSVSFFSIFDSPWWGQQKGRFY